MNNPFKKTTKKTKKTAKQSQGFIQNATDTFHELALIFLGVIILGGLSYSLVESKNVLEGFWWAVVTAFTVGYGDVVPQTIMGRVIAGLLMTVSVFIIVPLITARMAAKMIVNNDAFTHKEQEAIRQTDTRLNAYLDTVEVKKSKKVSKK